MNKIINLKSGFQLFFDEKEVDKIQERFDVLLTLASLLDYEIIIEEKCIYRRTDKYGHNESMRMTLYFKGKVNHCIYIHYQANRAIEAITYHCWYGKEIDNNNFEFRKDISLCLKDIIEQL